MTPTKRAIPSRSSRHKTSPAKSRPRRTKATATGGLLAKIGAYYKPIKQPVTLRLDMDVIAWFKKRGRGYQTRINRALRQVMMKNR